MSDHHDCEQAFNYAASSHKGEFKSLMLSRGIPSEEERKASLRNIVSRLQVYSENTVLLFYHHDGVALSIWAVSNQGSVAWDVNKITQLVLHNAIYGFRNSIKTLSSQTNRAPLPRSFEIPTTPNDYKSLSLKDISKILLPKEIEGVLKASRHILIVPCLEIGSIPFSALKLLQCDRLLVDIATVTILPSLFDCDNVNIGAMYNYHQDYLETNKALVVGNPAFGNDKDWNLPALPGSEIEAKLIASKFNSSILLGNDATKSNILKSIGQVNVLYFATHGMASNESPLDKSFLALAGENTDESRLTAREIQKLELDGVKLVVLSACQTGLGGVKDAGIVGLARAFKIAGASDVVVSLWNVDDHLTAKLMVAFIQNYADAGYQNAALSLQRTMKGFKEKYSDPKHWASFIVVSGEGEVDEVAT